MTHYIRNSFLVVGLVLMTTIQAFSIGGMPEQYCNVPVRLQNQLSLEPNVLLALDDSISIDWEAYLTNSGYEWQGGEYAFPFDYNNTESWFGIFEAEKCYTYTDADGGYFQPVYDSDADYSCLSAQTIGGFTRTFSGSFLNLASGTRLEIIKKVLVGGIYDFEESTGRHYVYGDPDGNNNYQEEYDIHTPAFHLPTGIAQVANDVEREDADNGSTNPDWDNLQNHMPRLHIEYDEAPTVSCSTNRVTINNQPQGTCVAPAFTNPLEHSCSGVPDQTFPGQGCPTACAAFPGATCTETGGSVVASCTNSRNNRHARGWTNTQTYSVHDYGHGGNNRRWCAWWERDPFPPEVCFSRCDEITFSTTLQATCSIPGQFCSCDYDETVCTPTGGGRIDKWYNLRILVDAEPVDGLMHNHYTKARWGFQVFGNTGDGGRVQEPVGASQTAMINGIRRMRGVTGTPLSRSLWSAIRYFQHIGTGPYDAAQNYPFTGQGSPSDPYYSVDAGGAVACRPGSIMLITDGSPSGDTDNSFPGLPASALDSDGDGVDPSVSSSEVPWWPPTKGGGVPVFPSWGSFGNSSYSRLDDIAHWAHTNDIRPDLVGDQTLDIMTVYAFGVHNYPRYLLWNTGKNGFFKDSNGNGQPDIRSEWDADDDYIPDGFFVAENGNELKESLENAFSAIVTGSASTAPLSYLGAAGGSGGLLLQSFFTPKKLYKPNGEYSSWLGYLRSFFIDRFANFREDSDQDQSMDLDDRALRFRYDDVLKTSVIDRYNWPTFNSRMIADDETPVDSILLEEMKGAFDAGVLLAERDPNDRLIYTSVGSNPSDFITFDIGNSGAIEPHLGPQIGNSTDAQDVIRYIRGETIPGFRQRAVQNPETLATNEWKLGDAINGDAVLDTIPSDLRVPAKFEEHNDGVDFGDYYTDLYNDYAEYVSDQSDRDFFLYVPANDGMLHAFTIGKWETTPSGNLRLKHDGSGKFPTPNGLVSAGHEAWAYIPKAALPHLNWLTENEYCHVYTVDGPITIKDMQIFTPDGDHKNGWGRVLMMSLNLGCPLINHNGDQYFSSWVMLDITDPYAPEYIYEYTFANAVNPDPAFATVPPVVIQRLRASGTDQANLEYQLVVMEGPSDDRDLTRAGPMNMRFIDLPVQGAGGFVARPPVPLMPSLLSGFIPTSVFVADEEDYYSSPAQVGPRFPTAPFTITPPLIPAGRDQSSDVLYIAGYTPSGTELDGHIVAIDLRLFRGTEKDFPPALDPYTNDPTQYRQRLLVTHDNQPIRAMHFPSESGWIIYGTGRYTTASDANNASGQAIYTLWDPCINRESGATPTVDCFTAGQSSPELPRGGGPVLISNFKSNPEFCSENPQCSGPGCTSIDNVRSNFANRYMTHYELEHPDGLGGERLDSVFTSLQLNGADQFTVSFSTVAPVSSGSGSCDNVTSNLIRTIRTYPLDEEGGKKCLGELLEPELTGGQQVVTPFGRINNDNEGNINVLGGLPKPPGPFLGFGATSIDRSR